MSTWRIYFVIALHQLKILKVHIGISILLVQFSTLNASDVNYLLMFISFKIEIWENENPIETRQQTSYSAVYIFSFPVIYNHIKHFRSVSHICNRCCIFILESNKMSASPFSFPFLFVLPIQVDFNLSS